MVVGALAGFAAAPLLAHSTQPLYSLGSQDSNSCAEGYIPICTESEARAAADWYRKVVPPDFVNVDREDRPQGCFRWLNGGLYFNTLAHAPSRPQGTPVCRAATIDTPQIEFDSWPHAVSVAPRSTRIARVYTVFSTQGQGKDGTWGEILRHFNDSLQASSSSSTSPLDSDTDGMELRVLRFNASSHARILQIGGDMPLDAWSDSMYYPEAKKMEQRIGRKRWLAWHAAMFFKAESWTRVARDTANLGKVVVCADADHTFFPGWQKVVESCLEKYDLCFEANFATAGTEQEAAVEDVEVPEGRPDKSFWRIGWVNTGLFAMRCGPAAHNFWASVMLTMRHLFKTHGHSNDQTTANVLLPVKPVSWALLDPHAVNQLSSFTLLHQAVAGRQQKGSAQAWQELGPRAQRMLDAMVMHHAAYTDGRRGQWECDESTGSTAACKLRLMRLANQTWYSRRKAPSVD